MALLSLTTFAFSLTPGQGSANFHTLPHPAPRNLCNMVSLSDAVQEEEERLLLDGNEVKFAFDGVVVPTQPAAPAVLGSRAVGWYQNLRGGAMTQREKAADLLKRYGGAYILCSLSLSACSFALFYLLVSSGVDVAALLRMIGISLKGKSERLGTIGLAYLLHKAASPIRFPPTLALTVVVGKKLQSLRGEDAKTSASA